MIQPAWCLRPTVVSDGKHSDEMVQQKQGMWTNHVQENAAFDSMQFDQDVSYESNLPPDSCRLFSNKYDREERLKYEPIRMVTLKHCVD